MRKGSALILAGVMLAGCAGPPPMVAVPRAPTPSDASQPKERALPAQQGLAERLAQSVGGLDRTAFGAVSLAEAQGRVLLTGAVVRPDYRRQLDQRVSQVPGVVSVTDRVVVTDAQSLAQYQPDTAKERDIAARIALPGLAVRVVKGVVYLIGHAQGDQIGGIKDALADDPAIKWVDASAVD